ncbi:hypothetical protein K491DRAFT_676062 [Lophiostoma macrostomum CBS 122681]|uniref:Uncharacterized protein n=1 Tax=Lophiostoma macrostomum CBS 122681 TaxID=1314788 RepID=A0A6A6TG12_9PLEO|nr:hypothetical protein K491DRAFT_676062 [Lophiostoma macrostomum CBS 122681]
MLSKFISLAAVASIIAQTSATPTPEVKRGIKYWSDNRPNMVPTWNTYDGQGLDCGDECSDKCWSFKKTRVALVGQGNYQTYAGMHASVNLGDDTVIPNKDQTCHTCNDMEFPGKDNNGWLLTLHMKGAPMEGPLPVNIGFPASVALFNADDRKPFLGDQTLTMDDITCDAWQCGGGLNPMTCRNCVFSHQWIVYHAEPIKDNCNYYEE